MAKECVCCGVKTGFIHGSHFDGLICDDCYVKVGGRLHVKLECAQDWREYSKQYQDVMDRIDKSTYATEVKEKLKKEFYNEINALCKQKLGCKIDELKEQEVKFQTSEQRGEISKEALTSKGVISSNHEDKIYELLVQMAGDLRFLKNVVIVSIILGVLTGFIIGVSLL